MKYIFLFFLIVCSRTATFAQQVKEAEVPANIRTVATQQSDKQPITLWVLDKNRKKYIASIIRVPVLRNIEVSLDGKWLRTTDAVSPDQFPAVVMRVVRESFLDKGYDGSNYIYIQEPGSKRYAVDVSSDEEDLHVVLDASGKVLSKEAR
jgi:hypothetical protein